VRRAVEMKKEKKGRKEGEQKPKRKKRIDDIVLNKTINYIYYLWYQIPLNVIFNPI